MGCSTPVSLLAVMIDTKTVRGGDRVRQILRVYEAVQAQGQIGHRGAVPAVRALQALSTAGCSVAWVIT